MLKLVHEYLNRKWDETGLSLEKIRSNIMEANPESSISVSRLHRIFSDPNYKLALEELIQITRDGFKQNPQEILAAIGGQEYAASKAVDYKGATELIADFNRREQELLTRAQMIRTDMQLCFDKALATLDESYRVRLDEKDERIASEAKHSGAAMKSVKWWRGVAVGVTSVLAVIFVYLTWEIMHLDRGATAILIQMVKEGLI